MSAPTTGYQINSGEPPHFAIPNVIPVKYANNTTATYFDSFTLECWVYVNSLNENVGLFCTLAQPGISLWSSNGLNLYLRTEANQGFAFAISGVYIRGGSVPVGAWFHFAATYNSNYIASIYINGSQIISARLEAPNVGQGPFIHPVYNIPPSGAANARINRFRIWNRALTAAEITEAKDTASFSGATPNLICEYLFDAPTRILRPTVAPPAVLYGAGDAPTGVAVTGNATKAGGGPVDSVLIRNFDSHITLATATPDENGDWSAIVSPGRYDITYLADGCAPICHGPYTILPD